MEFLLLYRIQDLLVVNKEVSNNNKPSMPKMPEFLKEKNTVVNNHATSPPCSTKASYASVKLEGKNVKEMVEIIHLY